MQLFVEKRCVAKSPLWPECKAGDFTDCQPCFVLLVVDLSYPTTSKRCIWEEQLGATHHEVKRATSSG